MAATIKKPSVKDLAQIVYDLELDFLKVGDIEIRKTVHFDVRKEREEQIKEMKAQREEGLDG